MTDVRQRDRTWMIVVPTWGVIAFLFLPALVVIPTSFTSTRYLAFPPEGMSLKHWDAFFASAEWIRGIITSLGIGLASTAIAVAMGTACAVGLWQTGSRLNPYIRGLLMLPLIVPSVV